MGTKGLRCSNLQSGSLHSWLCITTNILWRGCMCNKVLGYNLLIRPRVQLYLYSGIKHCYWFRFVLAGTAKIFCTGMQTGTGIPQVPPWVKFRAILVHFGHSSQFRPICKFWPVLDLACYLKKKKKLYLGVLLMMNLSFSHGWWWGGGVNLVLFDI